MVPHVRNNLKSLPYISIEILRLQASQEMPEVFRPPNAVLLTVALHTHHKARQEEHIGPVACRGSPPLVKKIKIIKN